MNWFQQLIPKTRKAFLKDNVLAPVFHAQLLKSLACTKATLPQPRLTWRRAVLRHGQEGDASRSDSSQTNSEGLETWKTTFNGKSAQARHLPERTFKSSFSSTLVIFTLSVEFSGTKALPARGPKDLVSIPKASSISCHEAVVVTDSSVVPTGGTVTACCDIFPHFRSGEGLASKAQDSSAGSLRQEYTTGTRASRGASVHEHISDWNKLLLSRTVKISTHEMHSFRTRWHCTYEAKKSSIKIYTLSFSLFFVKSAKIPKPEWCSLLLIT